MDTGGCDQTLFSSPPCDTSCFVSKPVTLLMKNLQRRGVTGRYTAYLGSSTVDSYAASAYRCASSPPYRCPSLLVWYETRACSRPPRVATSSAAGTAVAAGR